MDKENESRWETMLRGLLVFLLLLVVAVIVIDEAYAQPEPGLYWNPDESGRGFTVDYQNGLLALTIYIYDEDGSPIWYLAAGEMSADRRTLTARALEFENGQCIGCPYTPPDVVGDAGTITITFSGRDRATLRWQGQTIPVERQNFGFPPPPASMLGNWLLVSDVSGLLANGYSFTRTIPTNQPENGGTGIFIDDPRNAAGECFASGDLAGTCLIVDLDSSGAISRVFAFVQRLDRLEGALIDPNTGDVFPMQGWQTADGRTVANSRSLNQIDPRAKSSSDTLDAAIESIRRTMEVIGE